MKDFQTKICEDIAYIKNYNSNSHVACVSYNGKIIKVYMYCSSKEKQGRPDFVIHDPDMASALLFCLNKFLNEQNNEKYHQKDGFEKEILENLESLSDNLDKYKKYVQSDEFEKEISKAINKLSGQC